MSMGHSTFQLFCVLPIVAILGCGEETLSRPKAAALVEQYDSAEGSGVIRVTEKSFEEAYEMKLWKPGLWVVGQTSVTDEVFSEVSPVARSIKLSQPLAWGVTVTGITDAMAAGAGPVAKEAQFTAVPKDVPPWLSQADGMKERRGVALFRLYDDGWRVESVRVTDDVIFSIGWDRVPGVREEMDRRKAIEEAETARLERIRAAETPTRTIATYEDRCVARGVVSRLIITDTNVTVEFWSWSHREAANVYPFRLLGEIPPPRSHGIVENCVGLAFDPNRSRFSNVNFWAPPDIVKKAIADTETAREAWRSKYAGVKF